MKAFAHTEREALEQVAAEYRANGYDVSLDPTAESLPKFLTGQKVDMIARKGDERVVIEVKDYRAINRSPELVTLAERVNAQRGWRFELMAVHLFEYDEQLRRQWSEEELLDSDELLKSAELLLQRGYSEPALIVAWVRVEIALRKIARQADFPMSRSLRLGLKELITNGVLKRADYEFFDHALTVRNSLVHGARPSRSVQKLVEALLSRTTRLLSSSSQ